MKTIKTKDAVGCILCHDITQIIKDVKKDVVFKKGHIIKEEDIDVLLSVGKDNIYVYEKEEGMIHENEAAFDLADLCLNDDMKISEVKEGKVEIFSEIDGFFTVEVDVLNEINELEDIMIATRKGNIAVKKGDKLAGMRVIPLVIEKEKLDKAKQIQNGNKILKLHKFKNRKAAIVTTGNEVYYERIKDTFTPVIVDKLSKYGIEVINHTVCKDDVNMITDAIKTSKNLGAQIIICTGGMSVDPDDLTPSAIRNSNAEIITYGAPVLPGAMFLLGYFKDDSVIMGVPGCAMYLDTTIFDIMLPYAVAGIKVDKKHIAKLGYGGLCLSCDDCTYPNCQFGKGV